MEDPIYVHTYLNQVKHAQNEYTCTLQHIHACERTSIYKQI